MVIVKADTLGDCDAGFGQGREELVRIADAGEGQHFAPADGGDDGAVGFEPGVKNRQAVLGGAIFDIGGAIGRSDHDQRLRAVELRLQRRAQRACRNDAAVADAAAAVDDDDARDL